LLTILGAGMAGLVAAARARELGVDAVCHEKGDRPGGSMRLSSCVIWRYRSVAQFRDECPGGDAALQRLVVERLDDSIGWLESRGAEPVWQETGHPPTLGKRFDPQRLTDVLARAAADVRISSVPSNSLLQGSEPLLIASGGFQGSRELVGRHIGPAAPLRLRANPWSDGGGLRAGLARGAQLSSGMDEFYGRNMPDADFAPAEFVSLSQLYGRFARVFDEDGVEFFPEAVSWSEADLAQATARRPGARAYYLLDEAALAERVRERTVADMVAAAPTRVDPAQLPFPAPAGTVVAVRVAAAITHTVGSLRVDTRGRTGVEGLWAAGVDAGGIATGGYASGLASALVLGLAAAEDYAAAV
jgi:succinate dehydrogenase/fumarate reductase flavoprotein subunit